VVTARPRAISREFPMQISARYFPGETLDPLFSSKGRKKEAKKFGFREN